MAMSSAGESPATVISTRWAEPPWSSKSPTSAPTVAAFLHQSGEQLVGTREAGPRLLSSTLRLAQGTAERSDRALNLLRSAPGAAGGQIARSGASR